jgi:PST family polysaccharide transporter
MIWGVFVRLLGWPLGYWLIARGSMRTLVMIEVSSNVAMVALPIILLPAFGLIGTAIGYFIGYLLYALTLLVVARRRVGKWLGARTLLLFGAATLLMIVAQWSTTLTHGGYWGLVPTGVVTLGSFLVYRSALSKNL